MLTSEVVRACNTKIALIEDPRYLEHRSPPGHPERPERLQAVGQAIDLYRDRLQPLQPRPAEAEEITAIHSEALLRQLELAASQAPSQLDPDTYVSANSATVAKLAAGAALDLCLKVAKGDFRAAFAACRPPGHHAEANQSMGFCLLNNAAIAAQALRSVAQLDRVLIIDWDVHHGNGTQHIFTADPGIFYFSTHQFPYYPGTGALEEIGDGPGTGYTLNVPLPAGCGDTEYAYVFEHLLLPAARRYQPQTDSDFVRL